MGNGIKWEFDRIQSMAVHQRRQSKQKTPTECGHGHVNTIYYLIINKY